MLSWLVVAVVVVIIGLILLTQVRWHVQVEEVAECELDRL
jgi:hypothetical protein